MAGWGMCGILGAGLAVVRPRAGRLTLAVVCALAGVAYGALLNFSLMATYGGDLSVQHFLALEARAVPFDAAHAIGNAALALVAGPAMVRMLVRFRERFEWHAPGRRLGAAAGACAGQRPAGPRPGLRGEPRRRLAGLGAEHRRRLGVRAGPQLGPRHDRLGDAGARGVRPQPARHLQRQATTRSATCAATSASCAAPATCPHDPRPRGRRRRPSLISAATTWSRRWSTSAASNGSYEGWPGSTAFAVIALRAAGGRRHRPVDLLAGQGPERRRRLGRRHRLAEHRRRHRRRDAGDARHAASPSTASATCATSSGPAAALRSAAPARSTPSRPPGRCRGCWRWGPTRPRCTSGARAPLEYLAARQDADGHYRYSASSDQTPVWVTGQVLAATAGDSFPVPPVPRAARRPRRPKPTSAPASPVVPPATGAAPESPESPVPGSAAGVPPATGGVGSGPARRAPRKATPEGDEAEPGATQPAAPSFEAGDNPGPSPGPRSASASPPAAAPSAASSSSAAASAGRRRAIRSAGMDVETAIRTRRTHKAFGPEPLSREQIEELLELARWAPNHNLTAPWRFRVVGPRALERLKQAAGPEGAAKLDRAPTLIVVSCRARGDPVQDEEDLHATAVASYIVLLAAHARGLAGYWRTPGLLRSAEGRARRRPARRASASSASSTSAAPRQEKEPPERPPVDADDHLPRLMGADADPRRGARGDRRPALRGGRDRRRHHRRRRRPRRRLARLLGGAAGARRLRGRHLQPLLEDGPRRPPLPAELRPRPGPRGAAGAPADGAAGAAPRLPDAVPRPLLRRGAARPQTRHRAQHVRRDGDHAGRPQPSRDALLQGGGRGLLLVARPPPHDRPRRGARDGPRAGAARPRTTPTSSTTARPTTCGWC